jgi:hypothetical protein
MRDWSIGSGGNVSAGGRAACSPAWHRRRLRGDIERTRIGPVFATLPKGASVTRVHTYPVISGAESVARVQEFCLKAAELRGVAS